MKTLHHTSWLQILSQYVHHPVKFDTQQSLSLLFMTMLKLFYNGYIIAILNCTFLLKALIPVKSEALLIFESFRIGDRHNCVTNFTDLAAQIALQYTVG